LIVHHFLHHGTRFSIQIGKLNDSNNVDRIRFELQLEYTTLKIFKLALDISPESANIQEHGLREVSYKKFTFFPLDYAKLHTIEVDASY